MTVRIHIERLVVDANLAGNPSELELAVAVALTERFGTGPRPAWWGSVDVATLPATLAAGATPLSERVGHAIAQSLATGPAAGRGR